jgi:glycyl-radical enzyme activating protein
MQAAEGRPSDELTGLVFEIQRFAIHDGPGIRTSVFLKGCPLRCLWCHNPEGQSAEPQLFYLPEKCIACRYCEGACRRGNHSFVAGTHLFDRANCAGCGECTRECYARALELSGREMTVSQVLAQALKDRDFYAASGGGLTLSGGEPMQQFDFALALLKAAHQAGLHTCLETSGCSSTARYLEIRPWVDLFLYDIKETDPARHRQYTGVSNDLILANLLALDAECARSAGAALVLRCPIIPGLNDRADHFAALARLAEQLSHLVEIHILPYHPLGGSKRQRLGLAPALPGVVTPDDEQVAAWVEALQRQTRVRVRRD